MWTTRWRSAGWRPRATGTWRATCAPWPTDLGVPCGAVLEGGYDVDALAASVAATMDALAHGGEPRSVARGPLVEAEASQVARFWPAVSA